MANRSDKIIEGAPSRDAVVHSLMKRSRQGSAYDPVTSLPWVSGVLIVVLLGAITVSSAAYLSGGAWQMLVIAGTSLLLSIGLGIILYRGRRGDGGDQAASSIMALLVVGLLTSLLVLDGLDLYFLAGGIVVILAVDGLLFQRRLYPSLIAMGLLAGGAILNRVTQPLARYDVPLDPTASAGLAMAFAVLLLVFGHIAIRFARTITIGTRLLMTSALVSLLPSVLIAGALFIFGYRGSETRALEVLSASAGAREERLDVWVTELSVDLSALRVLEETHLQALLSSAPDSQSFRDSYDTELARLSDVLSVYDRFDVLLVVDTEGRLVLSTTPGSRLLDLGDSAYLEQGLLGLYAGPLVRSALLDEPAITVAIPVESDAGAPLGVLVGQAGTAEPWEILSDRTGLSANVEMYVVDDAGRLLTGLPELQDHRLAVSEGVDALLASYEPQVGRYENYAGETVIGVYRWLPSLQVGMVTEVDASALTESILMMLGLILLISVCSSLVAIGVAAGTARAISRPLAAVARAATRIAAGNLDVMVPVEPANEIGQLSAAVDRMTRRLRALVSGLEERDAAREADLARRSSQLESAACVAREVASIRDIHQLQQAAVDQIAEQFGLYHVGLYLVDDASRTVVLRASSPGGGEDLLARGFRMDIEGQGIIVDAVLTGRANLVLEVARDPRCVVLPELPETRSEMSLPLRIRDDVVGVLDVRSDQAGFFIREDAVYLQTVADQIALALENATLFGEAEARLHEIGLLVGAERQEGWQRLASSHPNWAYVYDGFEARPLSETALRIAEPDLVLPLGDIDGRVGVVKVQRRPDGEETPGQIALAQAIAKETGLALERARLFGDTQDALVEIGVLYRSGRAVIGAETLQGILRAIADNVTTPELDRSLLIVPTASQAPGADGSTRVRVAAVMDLASPVPGLSEYTWSEEALPALGRSSTGLLVLEDVASDETLDEASRQALLEDIGIRAALVAPLSAGQRLVGWLIIGATQPYVFSAREERLYRALSDLAAAVVRNFQLLDLVTNQAERAQALGAISSRMRETLDMDLILQTTLREIGESLGVSDIEVWMHGGKH